MQGASHASSAGGRDLGERHVLQRRGCLSRAQHVEYPGDFGVERLVLVQSEARTVQRHGDLTGVRQSGGYSDRTHAELPDPPITELVQVRHTKEDQVADRQSARRPYRQVGAGCG
ncbi:MAG: hypothetical protein ACRDSP_03815 [Pseudonocardiaceae bacterium]